MFKWLKGLLKMDKTQCHYCENDATKTVVWLKGKDHMPARIKLPWCGCDLMEALRKIWGSPYQVVEGVDYEVEAEICPPKKKSKTFGGT